MATKKSIFVVAIVIVAFIAHVTNGAPTDHHAKSKAEEAQSRQVAGLDIAGLLTVILQSLERILVLIKLNSNGVNAGNAGSWNGGGISVG